MFGALRRCCGDAHRRQNQGWRHAQDAEALANAGWLAVFCWAASRVYGSGRDRNFLRRLRFVLRSYLSPWRMASWVLSLIDGPMHATALRVPRLFEKPQRLYLNRHWDAARRHATLCDHYDWLCRAFTPGQIDLLYGEAGIQIARLESALPQAVTIGLRYDAAFEREGELALSLRLDDRTVLNLAFSVGCDALGRRQLMIGCLQSRDADDALEAARELTHALHGLRPKALLTAVAQGLAAASGMTRVLAVADEAHVFRGLRYLLKRQLIRRHRILACYDALWAECGGEPRPDGFYEMPAQARRRDPASIRSNKRAMYRRRYAMLDAIEQQLRALPVDWSGGGIVVPPLIEVAGPSLPLPARSAAAAIG